MNRVSGMVVCLIAIAILWQGRSLHIGSLRAPGPGFFPSLLAVALIVLSLFLIIPSQKKEKKLLNLSSQTLSRVLTVYLVLLAYFFILPYLGFFISGFILMIFLFAVIDRQTLKMATLRAFIFMVLAYLLFDVLLKSQLPQGVLGI